MAKPGGSNRSRGGSKSSDGDAGLPAPTNGQDPIRQEVERQIGQILPAEKRSEVVNTVTRIVTSFSGPLPPPVILAQYEDVHPGLVDRIVRMAETELEANKSLNAKQIEIIAKEQADDALDRRRGMWLGFSALALLALCALGALYLGSEKLGFAFLASTAVGVVAMFIKGRPSADKAK